MITFLPIPDLEGELQSYGSESTNSVNRNLEPVQKLPMISRKNIPVLQTRDFLLVYILPPRNMHVQETKSKQA